MTIPDWPLRSPFLVNEPNKKYKNSWTRRLTSLFSNEVHHSPTPETSWKLFKRTESSRRIMVPSVGRGEEVSEGRQAAPPHRYYTRSSREQQQSSTERRWPSSEREFPKPAHQTNRKPTQLSSRPPLTSENHPQTETEGDAQDTEMSQPDSMMDQVTYSTSNSVRVPFPSPAMKSTQPFYPFPPQQGTPQQYSLSDGGGWSQQQESMSWHQGGAGGTCILVEAANRAQMAILVDDMGSLGFEPMEQT